jgi:hypothetical protein
MHNLSALFILATWRIFHLVKFLQWTTTGVKWLLNDASFMDHRVSVQSSYETALIIFIGLDILVGDNAVTNGKKENFKSLIRLAKHKHHQILMVRNRSIFDTNVQAI